MSVTIRDTTGRLTPEARSQAKRFGAQVAELKDKQTVRYSFFDGFIFKALKLRKHVFVTVLSPGPIWWYAARYENTAFGEGSDVYSIGQALPGKYCQATHNQIATPEADIPVFTPDTGLQFPKRHFYVGAAPSLAVGDITRWRYGSPALNGQTAVLPDTFYDITTSEVNGWRGVGHVNLLVTGGDSSFVHILPTEAEATKQFSTAVVNSRAFLGLASTDFGTAVNVGPCEGVGANLYPTPYGVNVREETPETIDGVEQPLRYNDFIVATPVTLGNAPARINETRHDFTEGGTQTYSVFTKEYVNPEGLAFARLHAPFDKTLTGHSDVTVSWNTTFSMLDSGVTGVPPGDLEYKARDLEDWGILVPPYTIPLPPANYSGPMTDVIYCNGYTPHHITSFNCSVREPVTNEAVPPRGVAVGDAPAQLVAVCTSWTNHDDPDTPGHKAYCFSTRCYTVALSDGAIEEADIYTASREAVAPDFYDPFDYHYVYAACGQAVPLVKIGVNCDPALITTPPAAFSGQEDPGSTELKLVYAGGVTITHDLNGYCPPRPIMRGGLWPSYTLGGFQQFGYDTNDPTAVSRTVYVVGNTAVDVSGDLDVNEYTNRRTVIPELCSQQRICVNLGSGRIATLACTKAAQGADVRLDWFLVTTFEDNGAFDQVRGTVFEDLPLESSGWISLNVVQPEGYDANGDVTRPAVLVASVRSPTQFLEPRGGPSVNGYLFPIHARDNNYPSTEQFDTGGAPMVEYHNETRISRDGGATWETLVYNVGAEAYFLGNALKPQTFPA